MSDALRAARRLPSVALGLFLAATPLPAATLQVGGAGAPYQSVQVAIDAAVAGVDDVAVACGVYTENLVLRNGVDVIGAGAACAIVDGGAAGNVVRAVDISSTTTLAGLTLRNGLAAQGGGLFLEASALTVRDMIVEDNQAVGASFPDGVGGGIHIQTAFQRAPAEPVIARNIIRRNVAERFGGGISVDTDDGATIANNVITGNSAGLAGGGIDLFAAFPDIVNNTIVRNCDQSGGPACQLGGGGVSMTDSGVVDFHNNVVAWNAAPAGRVGGVDLVGSTIVDFLNNDAWGNLPVDYSAGDDPTGTAGNVAVAPLFADEGPTPHGFQPRSDSPLIDAGTAAPAASVDVRGVPRPVDGDADGAALVDIGARENEGATRLRFAAVDQLSWDSSIDGSAVFDVYRGDLAVLHGSGVYTQDPGTVAGAARWCDLPAPTLVDADAPAAGETRFYLAVIEGAVEGTLGFDGVPSERQALPANRCP